MPTEPEQEGEVECAVCGEMGLDRRTLTLKFGYELSEHTDKLSTDDTGFYTVQTCKKCRGDFIAALWAWLRGELLQSDDPHANIPVRIAGATRLLTRAQYDEWRAHG